MAILYKDTKGFGQRTAGRGSEKWIIDSPSDRNQVMRSPVYRKSFMCLKCWCIDSNKLCVCTWGMCDVFAHIKWKNTCDRV